MTVIFFVENALLLPTCLITYYSLVVEWSFGQSSAPTLSSTPIIIYRVMCVVVGAMTTDNGYETHAAIFPWLAYLSVRVR